MQRHVARVSVGTGPAPVPQHLRREVQLGQWELGMLQSPSNVRTPTGHTGEPREPRVINKSKAMGIKGNNTLENVDRKRSAFCQRKMMYSYITGNSNNESYRFLNNFYVPGTVLSTLHGLFNPHRRFLFPYTQGN